jgi:hypothetical protein
MRSGRTRRSPRARWTAQRGLERLETRASTATGVGDGELGEVDWSFPASIPSARRTREARGSIRASRGARGGLLWWDEAAAMALVWGARSEKAGEGRG